MTKGRWEITQDRAGKFRASLFSTNGNRIITVTKGYSTKDEIIRLIEMVREGDYFVESEVANVHIKGHAQYFMLFNSEGRKIFISKIYRSEGHANTRNQITKSLEKGIQAIARYKEGTIK
jgi:uncharacterized protein YegP (UPF0339 family)